MRPHMKPLPVFILEDVLLPKFKPKKNIRCEWPACEYAGEKSHKSEMALCPIHKAVMILRRKA